MNRTNPIILQINQQDFVYTKTEKKILEFFLKNPAAIQTLSITQIAHEVGVSEAAVTRFSKKAGYSGFNELKLLFTHRQSGEEIRIQHKDTLNTLTEEYVRQVNDVSTLINIASVDHLAQKIRGARRIKFYCTEQSFHTAEDTSFRLYRLGYPSSVFTRGYALRSDSITSEPGDIVLAISLCGKDRDILFAMQQAKKRGASCALITHFSDSPMITCADHHFVIPSRNMLVPQCGVSPQLAVLFLCDYLIAKITEHQTDAVLHKDKEFFSLLYSDPA